MGTIFKLGEKLSLRDELIFRQMNPGYEVTGETLAEEWTDDSADFNHILREKTTYVVFRAADNRHACTRYGMVRDCGDHYIIARYDRYDRIDKDTFHLTLDVEDK